MKTFAILSTAVAATALFGTSIASADIMVGSAGTAWQAWPGSINNYANANRPYWDNPSRDVANPNVGGPENIGNYLSGPFSTTVTPSVSSPGITPAWWGKVGASTANMDTNCYFNRGTSIGPIVATLLVESTFNAAVNVVGWYDVDHPASRTVLWNGAASATNNAEVTFTPTANWGFWLNTPNGTYYMQSSLSQLDKTHQHMTTFQASSSNGNELYYVGMEDLPVGAAPPENSGDFNDFILKFQSTGGGSPVPEPTSLALLGIGAVALITRRRK